MSNSEKNQEVQEESLIKAGLRKGYFYRSCVLNLDMNYDDMILSIANTGLSSLAD